MKRVENNQQGYNSKTDRDKSYGKKLACKPTRDSNITQNSDRFTSCAEELYDALESFTNLTVVNPTISSKLEFDSSLQNSKCNEKYVCEVTKDDNNIQNLSRFTSCADEFYDALESFTNLTVVNPTISSKLEFDSSLQNKNQNFVCKVAKDDNSVQNSSRFTSNIDEFYDALESMTGIGTEDKTENIIKTKYSTTKHSKIKNQFENKITNENEFRRKDISKIPAATTTEDLCINPKRNTRMTKDGCQKEKMKGKDIKHHPATVGNFADLTYDELYKFEESNKSDSANTEKFQRTEVGEKHYEEDRNNFTTQKTRKDTNSTDQITKSLYKMELIEHDNQELKVDSNREGTQLKKDDQKFNKKVEAREKNYLLNQNGQDNKKSIFDYLETDNFIHNLSDDIDKMMETITNNKRESKKYERNGSGREGILEHHIKNEKYKEAAIQRLNIITTESPCKRNVPEMSTKEQITQLVKKLRSYHKEKENSIEEVQGIKKKLVELMQKQPNT